MSFSVNACPVLQRETLGGQNRLPSGVCAAGLGSTIGICR